MHSPPIVGMTIALLFSLGTCTDQIKTVWVNFACTKRLFNLLAEAIINVRNVGLCSSCAIFLSKIKQTPFSCRLVKGFTFLKGAQNQFEMLLEMPIVQASIVPTDRNASLLWLCNNSEIHLCLLNVWRMVVCSQNFFYVTGARKDKKTDKTRFCFARKR